MRPIPGHLCGWVCLLSASSVAFGDVSSDVDRDCDTDIHDYAWATRCLSPMRATDCSAADLNNDGQVGVLDVAYLATRLVDLGPELDAGPCRDPLVGTFFGGWSRNRGNYIWIGDHGQGARFVTVADVDGDGYEDALIVTDGEWEVALSERYVDLAGREIRRFGDRCTWLSGFGTETDIFLVGDLNGDQLADAAAYDPDSGSWSFATSDGTALMLSSLALTNTPRNAQPLWADVNGDRRDDVITYAAGTWEVRLALERGFAAATTFATGLGGPAALPFAADVDGDDDADAVVVENGEVRVALSDGASFAPATIWRRGLSFTEIMLADATGDALVDLVLFHRDFGETANIGRWEICPSNGTNAFDPPLFFCQNHGTPNERNRASKGLPAADRFFTGYVQTPIGGVYGVSPIAFNDEFGHWQVMPPYGMFSNANWQPGFGPNWYCSWHYNNRAAVPRIGQTYFGYDAEVDNFAIAALIKELALAEIDFVLLDQSNPWGALLAAHQVFAIEISKWNAVPGNRPVKYAICGRYKAGPAQVEQSAAQTLSDFYQHPVWGGPANYQYLDGKPLLVCYGGVPDKHIDWANYAGPKTNAHQFTLKWMDGTSTTESIGPTKGDWYGWYLPEGTIVNSDQMVQQPGFYNGNLFSSRSLDEIEGDWYRRAFWDRTLLEEPNAVTVISFVGDPEQNDVYDMAPGEYPYAMGRTEQWAYPEMYWEMTKDYIQTYRQLRAGKLEHIAEYGAVDVMQGSLTVTFTQPFPEPPVIFATVSGVPTGIVRLTTITSVTSDGFSATISNPRLNDDRLNWFAIRPGVWETRNGLRLAADVASVSQPVAIRFPITFNAVPALFSMPNSNSDGTVTATAQASVTATGFDLIPLGNLGQDGETIGWIAVETEPHMMWSGRLSGAQIETNVSQINATFTLPRYFYDTILTLAKSASASAGANGEVLVQSTTNLGGEIRYQSAIPAGDTLNLLSFDGRGGCLHGRPLD